MPIINIATYKFISLTELTSLRIDMLEKCTKLGLKGTILIAKEGINLNLAGNESSITSFKFYLRNKSEFAGVSFRESLSASQPFRRMKVKIKKEIITMRRAEIHAEQQRSPSLTPKELKQWLDEQRDMVLLDTRNDYEVRFGSFKNAVHFHLKDFSEFPVVAERQLSPEKTVVMFCTGGIRCEKAALHLENAGFSKVYQLDGGILNYFAQAGGAHFNGECFVFDERVSVDSALRETGSVQCRICQGPVSAEQQASSQYIPNVCCPACIQKKVS